MKGKGLIAAVLLAGSAKNFVRGVLFGRPESKIRKTVFYTLLAGTLMYKGCGEELNNSKQFVDNYIQDYKEVAELKRRDEINFIQSQKDSLENVLNNYFNAYRSLSDSVSSYRGTVNNLNSRLAQTNTQLNQTRTRAENTQNELNQMRTRAASTQNELNQTRRQVNSVRNELVETRSELEIKAQEPSIPQLNIPGREILPRAYRSRELTAQELHARSMGIRVRDNLSYARVENHYWYVSNGTDTAFSIARKVTNNESYAQKLLEYNNIQNETLGKGFPVMIPAEIMKVDASLMYGQPPIRIAIRKDETLDQFVSRVKRSPDILERPRLRNNLVRYNRELGNNLDRNASSDISYVYLPAGW
jgi:hypothetical protein